MAGITGRNPYIPPVYGSPAQTMPGYQMPGYWPGYQQQLMQPVPQVQSAGQGAGAPQMSMPTVHADILQVADEEAMEKQPVDAGTSQMMITRDETLIGIKSVLANGESTLELFRKQPKATKKPEADYVTREEFEQRLAEMVRAETSRREPPSREIRRSTEEEITEEPDEEYREPEPRTATRTRTSGGSRR